MKNKIIILLTLISLISCTEDNGFENDAECTLTPTLTTNNVTFESDYGVKLSGIIKAPTCESTVTSQGFVYSTTTLPKIDDSVIEINGENISIELSNLKQYTKYHYRTFFVNPTGEYYGNEVEFITPIGKVEITTKEIENITYYSAKSGGVIANDGGAKITARGVCWGTSPNPTISDFKTEDGSGIGSYESSLNELEEGTTYYARAYSTNKEATTYGNEITIQVPIRIPEYYNLTYTVSMWGDGSNPIPFEFQAIFITTNENNQRVEDTQTISGFTSNTDHYETNSIVVENYKIVGVKIIGPSNNVASVSVSLKKVSDQETIWSSQGHFDGYYSNEFTYDFDTNTDNVIQN